MPLGELSCTSSGSEQAAPGPPPLTAAAAAAPPAAAAASPALSDRDSVQELRRRAAHQACSFDRKLALFSLFFHGSTQVVSLLAWHALPASERWQRVASILYACLPWLIPTVVPEWYDRGQHRAWVLSLYRVGFFSFPLLRQPRGIQKVLGGAAQPGVRGLLKDLLRLIWGSRLVAVISSGVMVPTSLVPLVPQLLLLMYSVGMVRSNPSLCSATLTTHPLSQQRIRGLHDLLHLAGMLLPGGIGQATSHLQQHSTELDCQSFLSFFFILIGIVLPLVVLVWTEPPASLKAWEERRRRAIGCRDNGSNTSATGSSSRVGGSGSSGAGSSAADGSRGTSNSGSGGDGSSQKQPGLWGGACAAAGHAVLVLEAAMRELCGRSWMAPWAPTQPQHAQHAQQAAAAVPGRRIDRQLSADLELRWSMAGWQRGMAWWLLISLIWGACRLHHSLSLAA